MPALTGDRLYYGQLRRVDPLGVWATVPALGGNAEYGPLRSIADVEALAALPAGELLLLSTVGGLQDDLVVLGRVTGPAAPLPPSLPT